MFCGYILSVFLFGMLETNGNIQNIHGVQRVSDELNVDVIPVTLLIFGVFFVSRV